MKCLIDADILSYEISSCGQYYEPEDVKRETLIIRDFDSVANLLDQKIKEIVAECNSDEEPTLYLTGDEKLLYHVNRMRVRDGEEVKTFKPNFRVGIAQAKPYKGNRKQDKPFHFHNLRAYMLSQYDCIVTEGMEADDLICIDLYGSGNTLKNCFTIACTRDKDLRMCTGWHYGWKCGKQEQFGPTFIGVIGNLELTQGNPKKLRGTGLKFFYSQLLTGDTVDNIGGLPKHGPVRAFNELSECTTEEELYSKVKELYRRVYAKDWGRNLKEQCDLLWMVRELNDDGSLKFYEPPTKGEDLSVDLEELTPVAVES